MQLSSFTTSEIPKFQLISIENVASSNQNPTSKKSLLKYEIEIKKNMKIKIKNKLQLFFYTTITSMSTTMKIMQLLSFTIVIFITKKCKSAFFGTQN